MGRGGYKKLERMVLMSLTDIAALAWIALAGYALSVLQRWKQTGEYLRTEMEKMIREEDSREC